jgi:outer membrane biosynthesis protein TonB
MSIPRSPERNAAIGILAALLCACSAPRTPAGSAEPPPAAPAPAEAPPPPSARPPEAAADAGPAPPPPAAAGGCPPVGEIPDEPKYSASGTVLIARTVGERKGPPRIKPDDPRSGAFPAAVVHRVLHRDARPRILECYRAALARCPGLAGTIRVRFEIAADSSSRGVELAGPGLLPALDACVLAQVRATRFPSGETEHVIITWPFVFIPVQDLAAE